MLGLSIGLIVNIPDLKKQNQKLKEYGTAAMSMVVTLFSAGVFTGVLKNTGILDNMATAIVGLIPTALGPYTHFGVSAEVVAHTLLIAENVGVTISPLTPAVFLGLGVLDLELGEHIKYSIRWIWPVSILSVLAAVLVGVIPV